MLEDSYRKLNNIDISLILNLYLNTNISQKYVKSF